MIKGENKMSHTQKNSVLDSALQGTTYNIPDNSLKILASSIFRHLRSEGCAPADIINVSTHLLSLVTTEITESEHHAD